MCYIIFDICLVIDRVVTVWIPTTNVKVRIFLLIFYQFLNLFQNKEYIEIYIYFVIKYAIYFGRLCSAVIPLKYITSMFNVFCVADFAESDVEISTPFKLIIRL